MALKYMGKGEYIGGIPAQDISDKEIKSLLDSGAAAAVMGRAVSLAEFEGILIKSGLYKMVVKEVVKTDKKEV